jgi:hypothetical protein
MFDPLLRVFLSTQNLSRRLDAIEAVYYLHLFSGNTRVNVATFHAAAAQLYGIMSESPVDRINYLDAFISHVAG